MTISHSAQGRLQTVRTNLLSGKGAMLNQCKEELDEPYILILPRLGDHKRNDTAPHKVTKDLEDVCFREKKGSANQDPDHIEDEAD